MGPLRLLSSLVLLLLAVDRSRSYRAVPFPEAVRIYNGTVYWGCGDLSGDGKKPSSGPAPGAPRHQFIPSVNCSDATAAADVNERDCQETFPKGEYFLFMHHPNGHHNIFHAWVNDYLPLLRLVLGHHTPRHPSIDDPMSYELDEAFVRSVERPYRVIAFKNALPQAPHYLTEKMVHVDLLLSILDDNPVRLLPEKQSDTVYCFEPGSIVVHPWTAMLARMPEFSRGLVWQTQLYVRERMFGLEASKKRRRSRRHERTYADHKESSDKPVLVWVDRKPGDRYLHSWRDILSELSGDAGGFEVRVLDAGKLDPRELAVFMDDADILLGVHGAGLQNMVWMRPYSGVVEIRWPENKRSDRNYEKMSRHLEHFYSEAECYHLSYDQFSGGDMPTQDQLHVVNTVKELWKEIEIWRNANTGAKSETESFAADEL